MISMDECMYFTDDYVPRFEGPTRIEKNFASGSCMYFTPEYIGSFNQDPLSVS